MESDKGDLENKDEQPTDKVSSMSCSAFSDVSSVASMEEDIPQMETDFPMSSNFHDEAEYLSNGEDADQDELMDVPCDTTNLSSAESEEFLTFDYESEDSFVIPPTDQLSVDSDKRVNQKAKRKREMKQWKEFRAYILDHKQEGPVADVWSSGSDTTGSEYDSDEDYSDEEYSDEEFEEGYDEDSFSDEEYSLEYYDSEESYSEDDEPLKSRVVADLPIEDLPPVSRGGEIRCHCGYVHHCPNKPEDYSSSSSED